MQHEIVAESEYIRASYWGNDGTGSRLTKTNELISVSRTLQTYKFLIDTLNLESIMEPLDFFIFARHFLETQLANKVKVAIVCSESNQRSIYSKVNLNGMGILSNVFHTEESAINWLI